MGLNSVARSQVAVASPVAPDSSGLESCCQRLTKRSAVAAAAIRRAAQNELRVLLPGEYLARRSEPANAAWIIESGEIDVGKPRLKVRRQGEIVGEGGLLNKATRSADLIAAGPAQVWCISREAVERLSADERSAVYEALAANLLEKLEQAVVQRHSQLSDLEEREMLLRAFVPNSGLGLVRARLFNDPSATHIHRNAKAVVWFSDIAGFSALCKSMSPEEAGTAAIDLQTPIIRAIEDHNGELDKLMGDGAMAFWLAPGDDISEEVAASAVDAALAAARNLRSLAVERGWPRVRVRIGIHCGKVLIGDFGAAGRRSFTSIGPVVNTAARYEQARETNTGKPLGPVRISPEMWARLPLAHQRLFEPKTRQFKEKTPPMLRVHRLRSNIIGELE